MEACWPRLEARVRTGDFLGAEEEFQEFRQVVVGSTNLDLDAEESHAILAWDFLLGFAAVKADLRNQIIQVVYKLKYNAKFSRSWERSPKLASKADGLHKELRDAFLLEPRVVQLGHEIDMDPQIAKEVQRKLERLHVQEPPMIAIVGKRGVGKSTIVNSLMRLHPRDPRAAVVGADEVVNDEQRGGGGQTWTYNGLIFKDVAGCEGCEVSTPMGTEYIERFGLDKADAVLLVYTDVLQPKMLEFLILLGDKGVAAFLVRNKVGSACRRQVADGRCPNVDVAFDRMKATVHEQIDKGGNQCNITEQCEKFKCEGRFFLVEAVYEEAVKQVPTQKYQHEFLRLRQSLCTSILNEAKQAQITHVLNQNAEGLAQTRANLCCESIGYWVAAVSALGLIPVPCVGEGTTVALAIAATKYCLRQFCMHSDTLSSNEDPTINELMAELSLICLARAGGAIAIAGVSLAADALVFVPIGGVIIALVVGGGVAGGAMYFYMSKLIPSLQKIATKIYEINFMKDLDAQSSKTRITEIRALMDAEFPPSA